MRPFKQEVIDVDARVLVDLTKTVSIDLTADDNDIQEVSDATHKYVEEIRRFGPLSDIRIKEPAPAASELPSGSTSRHVASTSSEVSQPPAKKRKINPPTRVITIYDNEDNVKPSSSRQARVSSSKGPVLELDSDGDVVESRPKKLLRREDEDTDEEEAYARWHPEYDLNDSVIWQPLENKPDKITFDRAQSLKHLGISEGSTFNPDPQPPPRPHYHLPHPYPFVKFAIRKEYGKWNVKWLKPTPAPRHVFSLTTVQRLRRSAAQNVIQPMKQVTSFKHAPGSINHIEQLGNYVALASAATGGHVDEGSIGEIDPYNKEGSISVWNGKAEILPGHSRRKNATNSATELIQLTKYYTVNDVKIDPCSSSLVSAGNDKTVHIWTLGQDKQSKEGCYGGVAPEISKAKILVGRKNSSVGAMLWGYGPTANTVFTSTEPHDATKYVGQHKAVDVEKRKVDYSFEEDGAGDEIAVTDDGSRLALITRREDCVHSLRIYDIRRSNPEEQLSIKLQSFPSGIEGEVSSAAFSSDGVYIAMGRNDNHTHVYDSRFLDRLLFDYEHHGPSRTNPGRDYYGIVKVQWVDEDPIHPFGLVTGGNDGCVRFWDPTRAETHPRNGSVLAKMNSDVATFCIGDRYKGEHSLVVGDGSGEVAVFDFKPQGHHSIYR
ncbi:hypothetical protein H0H87_002153 [Tephrocybe sp. NHM501043]|nr:hypothetical protein H0H87_002153 [Tephrocybe sp. NHM501043]